MMNNFTVYVIVFLVSVAISSLSQVMLKKSALQAHASLASEYLNPLVVLAYMIFVVATFLHTFAYKYVPLSLGPILESTSYIIVPVLGSLLLKEKISLKKVMGIGIIVVGILIFSL